MIALNTWREIRFTTLLYVLVMESLLVIAILKWPSLRDETAKLAGLKLLLPADFMRRWVDGVMGPTPYQAYMAIQMYFKGINVVGVACASLYGTAIIARERENGTLALLLGRPVSRSRALVTKFAVLATAVVVPIFATSWTALPISWAIGENLPFDRVTLGAAYSSLFCLMFLAFTTAFSVRLRSQVDVSFLVGAIIVFEICIYFVPDVRDYSLFRLSDYDVYLPLLAGNDSAVQSKVVAGLWMLLAIAGLYLIADRLLQKAEP